MNNTAVSLGIIGMGGIAELHLANLLRMEGVTVTAICDIVPERATAAAKRTGGRPYGDWRAMLDDEALDGVLVCIPQFSRAGEVAEIARRRIPLFVEKPAAPTMELARANLDAIDTAGVVNAIGYMWRSSTCLEKLGELIDGRPVGLIHGQCISSAPFGTWFWDKERSGGQVFDQTTHIIDLARIFGGRVASVQAAGTVGRLIDEEWVKTEDVSGLLVAFANGTVGTFSNVWAHDHRASEQFSLSLYGRDFSITFDPMANRLRGHVDDVEISYSAPEETRNQELVNFIAAIRTGSQQPIRCPYEEGVRTLEVTFAANRALAERVEVTL